MPRPLRVLGAAVFSLFLLSSNSFLSSGAADGKPRREDRAAKASPARVRMLGVLGRQDELAGRRRIPGPASASRPGAILSRTPAQGWNMSLLGRLEAGGSCNAVAVEGNRAYVCFGATVMALDVSDRTSPQRLGSAMVPGDMTFDVEVQAGLAYVADDIDGMRILDFSDPYHPVEVGAYTPGEGWAEDIALSGTYAFVAMDYYGLRIVDVSNPAAPVEVGAFQLTPWYDEMSGVDVADTLAYVAAGSQGLRIVNVSDPTHPVELGYLITPDWAWRVRVSGNLAYVTASSQGLRIIDVSDPEYPFEVGYHAGPPSWPVDLALADSLAYVVGDTLLGVVDVGDPGNPVLSGSLSCDSPQEVRYDAGYVYVADAGYGLRIVEMGDPANPVQVGSYTIPGSMGEAVLLGFAEYIVLITSDMYTIDVSNPAAPRLLASLPLGGTRISAEDYLACVVQGLSGGITTVDVADPMHPAVLGGWSGFDTTIADVDLAGGYAYTSAYDFSASQSGLLVFDLSDPAAPHPVGGLWFPSYLGFGCVVVGGGYAYLSDPMGGLRIIDVHIPTSPSLAAELVDVFPGALELSGNYLFAAGGFPAERSSRRRPSGAPMQWEPVTVIDVSDPYNPQVVASVGNNDWVPIALSVCGRYLFVGDDSYGVRMVDVQDPTSPVVAGGYDLGWRHVGGVACWDRYVALTDLYAGLFLFENLLWQVPVAVEDFRARAVPGGVALRWELAPTPGVSGFNVYRSPAGEESFALLNPVPLPPASRSYLDRGARPGAAYDYRLEVLLADGSRMLSAVTSLQSLPARLALRAVPNPFRASTDVFFELPDDDRVTVAVYDVAGRLVKVLTRGLWPAGVHRLAWDGTDGRGRPVAPGVYLCRLKSGPSALVRKVTLLR